MTDDELHRGNVQVIDNFINNKIYYALRRYKVGEKDRLPGIIALSILALGAFLWFLSGIMLVLGFVQ